MSLGSQYLNQFQYTLEKDTVALYGSFTVDGYGAVATAQGGGIASIAQVTTGEYAITLTDGWDYLFAIRACVANGGTISPVKNLQIHMTDAAAQAAVQAASAINVMLVSSGGSATNPATTDTVRLEILMRRSSVGPYDDTGLIT